MTRWLLLCLVSFALSPANAGQDALIADATGLVKRYAGELKPQLKQALQQGGPAHAIQVCAVQAPQIAARLSAESGWQIKRVSLKPRNVNSATADDWERQVLLAFDEAHARGSDVESLFRADYVAGNFRFMKPQPVEPVCLACHGENLAPEVVESLRRYAPGDTAIGYKLGQIRGAFSLTRVAATAGEGQSDSDK